MSYGYIDRDALRGKTLRIPQGQYIAGHAIGIVHLEVWYPLLPGNVVNATTYPFPVRFKQLAGATQEKILRADPSLADLVIQAGRELQAEGCRALVGACGYFANYQRIVADALEMPVFLSSLLQVPLIHRSLRRGEKIGILCADAGSLRPAALAACGVTPDIPVAIMGLEDQPEFANILYSRGQFDYDRLEAEIVGAAQRLVAREPAVKAILLECSDMPPFAYAVQQAMQMPVFDFITMIRWVQSALAQRPYAGIA